MSNSKNNYISCHQVLHGYKDGHSMLATSLEFPPDVKRTMLTMSDMSGHSMVDGYEEYLTGYPIKELNMYVIAKTWYAPEMDRPGCVWTHSILFNFQDLIKINNKNQILDLFSRPKKDFKNDLYDSTLNISYKSGNLDRLNQNESFDSSLIKKILFELYDKPNIPVLLLEKDKNKFEDLVLSIWLQQWPRLRRNFSFCTGAISPRLLHNKILDLQITPIKKDNISKSITEVSVIDSMKINLSTSEDEWLSMAVNDLFQPMLLRDFFVNYGADLKPDRSSFKLLTELFLYFNKAPQDFSLKFIIDFIGEKFQNPNEAQSLKFAVLNGGLPLDNGLYSFEEMILALATTEYYNSYETSKNPILEKVKSRFETDSRYALKLLLLLINDNNINPIGVELLKVAPSIFSNLDSLIFNKEYRKLLLIFVHLNPEISYEKSFWKVDRTEQKENLSVLLQINKAYVVDWQKIINILIEENADVDFELLMTHIEGLIGYTLNILNQRSFNTINSDWVMLLKSNPFNVLEWLNNNNKIKDNLLKLILSVLNPNSNNVKVFGCKLWYEVLINNSTTDTDTKNRLKAFCVATALNNNDTSSIDLLSRSIETVYWALRNNELDYDSWKYIEIHTERLSYWNDWDKCKKLLNSLVKKFKENRWPFKDFGKMFSDQDILKYLIYKYNDII